MIVPGQLIPWKSISKAEDYNMTIPVHATLLSIISLASFTFGITFGILVFRISFGNIWSGLVIPFIIMKVIKTKKAHPVIPPVLQMYDENEDPKELEDDDDIRNGDFIQDENIVVNECIQVSNQQLSIFKGSKTLEICKENKNSEVVFDLRKLTRNEERYDDLGQETNMIVDEDNCIQIRGQSIFYVVNPGDRDSKETQNLERYEENGGAEVVLDPGKLMNV